MGRYRKMPAKKKRLSMAFVAALERNWKIMMNTPTGFLKVLKIESAIKWSPFWHGQAISDTINIGIHHHHKSRQIVGKIRAEFLVFSASSRVKISCVEIYLRHAFNRFKNALKFVVSFLRLAFILILFAVLTFRDAEQSYYESSL